MHDDLAATPMWTDVIDLQEFYATSLGQVARRLIGQRIRMMWPDLHGQRLAGVGFAPPYLRVFLGEAERVVAVMPASQGVMRWPAAGQPGLTVLADEADLPFPDRSIDRLLMVHTLEATEQVRAVMRDAWRVLADGGRLLVVAPNRRGIWSRLEGTPFGSGRPYTLGQLERLLRDNLFTPVARGSALFVPPSPSPLAIRFAAPIERMGRRWFETFGGVVLVEAAKEIYAGAARPAAAGRRPAYLPLPQGFSRAATPPRPLGG